MNYLAERDQYNTEILTREEYKHKDPIVAYRRYVINEKHYAKWEQNRAKPTWWTTQEVA